MVIPPQYTITPQILELVSKIDAIRIYLSLIKIPDLLKENIQRVSILKSSLFSARIEGNPLTLGDFDTISSDKQKKIEVFNILNAASFIDKEFKAGDKITKKNILDLHKIAMDNLTTEKGILRNEMGAIFNMAGVAVYVSPPPKEISVLINKFLEYLNSDFEKFPIVNAFISHLIFEKIHPFLDGNGRVGRLLVFLILKSKKQNFEISVPFEEYLDLHKDEYYDHLGNGLKNPNDYLLFMLEAFYSQSEKTKELIETELKKEQTFFLPPRQEEIYNIIKDHGVTSFDTIRRRFTEVPERTLRWDLKKLLGLNLITKSGKTKGSFYKVNGRSKINL